MRDRWRRRPQLESLESMTLLSSAAAMAHAAAHRVVAPMTSPAPKLPSSGLALLNGTAHGTFFAHGPSPTSGTIYSLFASGKVAPVGSTLLVGGFQTRGVIASDGSSGTIVFEAPQGNLSLRLFATPGPTASTPAASQYHFTYQVATGSGAYKNVSDSGTVDVTLQPINTNIHGQPVSNPGFFGNSTLTFHPNPMPIA